tara:strand:- start:572 stop:880 length:309 start_codon:yes stop_codon:yes gene_type:complete
MISKIIQCNIPDDILYRIFKQFLTDNKLYDICSVNKEWANLINKRLMITHLKIIISNTIEINRELELENYILEKNNNEINLLYDDLVDSVEEFMDLYDETVP